MVKYTPNTENSSAFDPSNLKKIYLFSALDDSQLREISANAKQKSLKTGERLFHQGDPCDYFFFVREGQIKLFRLSRDGDEKVIYVVLGGQTFAEAVMFMERKDGYPVDAESLEPSELLCFDSKTFVNLLKRSPDTCLRVMGNMSQRLRWQVNEIDRLTLHNATFRLISYLLDVCQEKTGGKFEARLTTPKNVLASWLSIQPETFSRILFRLSERQLLEVEGQTIRFDMLKLRQYIDSPPSGIRSNELVSVVKRRS
jgi:CRP-like cAMP-binding protein